MALNNFRADVTDSSATTEPLDTCTKLYFQITTQSFCKTSHAEADMQNPPQLETLTPDQLSFWMTFDTENISLDNEN